MRITGLYTGFSGLHGFIITVQPAASAVEALAHINQALRFQKDMSVQESHAINRANEHHQRKSGEAKSKKE